MRISGAGLVGSFAGVLAFIVGITSGFAQQGRIPGMSCDDRFVQMDKNKDGKLTPEEFKAIPHPEGNPEYIFRLKDTNRDGALTKKEYCTGKVKKKTQKKETEGSTTAP